jgi:uncharacterized protein
LGVYVVGLNPGLTKSNFYRSSGHNGPPFPELVTQTPEEVAKELVYALERRKKPRIVSG